MGLQGPNSRIISFYEPDRHVFSAQLHRVSQTIQEKTPIDEVRTSWPLTTRDHTRQTPKLRSLTFLLHRLHSPNTPRLRIFTFCFEMKLGTEHLTV